MATNMATKLFALFAVLFLLGGCGVNIVLPDFPVAIPTASMVKVATTTEGEMRFACELPYQQQCWLVNASVPDGISVVIAPEGRYLVPAQIIVHAGQWPVFNDKGRFMYFVERRPPDVGLILNVPHPDIYQHFYPGP